MDSWLREGPGPVVQPSTAVVGSRPPEGRLQGTWAPLTVRPAQGRGSGRWLSSGMGRGTLRSVVRWPSPVAWGQVGLSISRGALGTWLPQPG